MWQTVTRESLVWNTCDRSGMCFGSIGINHTDDTNDKQVGLSTRLGDRDDPPFNDIYA